MRRVVIDPGVLIAALISSDGAPATLYVMWRGGFFELVTCDHLLNELETVLLRAKFRKYATKEEVRRYVASIRGDAIVLRDPDVEVGLTPDPGDDYLVALARTAKAALLISGDRHLTRLARPDPPVLTPKAFLELLLFEERQ